MKDGCTGQIFPDRLQSLINPLKLPHYIADLARLELALHQSSQTGSLPSRQDIVKRTVNPSLNLVSVFHSNLLPLLLGNSPVETIPHSSQNEIRVIFWQDTGTSKVQYEEADDAALLALKIVVEGIDKKAAAAAGKTSISTIQKILDNAVTKGILLSPEPQIRRDNIPALTSLDVRQYLTAEVFTLQWHITQACDLRCKHCYDRSERTPLARQAAMAILADFHEFCREMQVKGQITFTGGNPLLYPHFFQLYQASAEYGFGIAILGNPSPAETIDTLTRIEKPLFFQISLEGLEEHNDTIRGKGHFQRSLTFLDQLRERHIFAMVMLTLTRDNLEQVLPLAELLKDKADFFTFNRLSTVGEGAQLLMAEPQRFKQFLWQYEAAARLNPIMGLKDNLFNIIRNQDGRELFGGCTGYGCGAAFNFLALLADGEVHACRKFPSPLGNIKRNRLLAIYRSELAQKYRTGSSSCSNCSLNAVCRGCAAITHSHGLDIFLDRDPFCFQPVES